MNALGMALRVIAKIYMQIEDYPGALEYFKMSQEKTRA